MLATLQEKVQYTKKWQVVIKIDKRRMLSCVFLALYQTNSMGDELHCCLPAVATLTLAGVTLRQAARTDLTPLLWPRPLAHAPDPLAGLCFVSPDFCWSRRLCESRSTLYDSRTSTRYWNTAQPTSASSASKPGGSFKEVGALIVHPSLQQQFCALRLAKPEY